MGIGSRAIVFGENLAEIAIRKIGKIHEYKKVNDKRRKELYANLTMEQQKAIDTFYIKNYGEKIPYNWHRLYTSYTGNFDLKYFPEFLGIPLLERIWNLNKYKYAFADKNVLPLLIKKVGNVVIPEIILTCTNGMLRDNNFEVINEDKATKILSQYEKVFIKPSVDSSSGIGCEIVSTEGLSLDDKKKFYRGNYCIQSVIKNNLALKKVYPYSVNTFRVISYIWNDDIKICPIVLRMGRNKRYLDNAHQDGIFIGVKDNGLLMPCAFSEFQDRFYSHPDTGIVFENYVIPKYEEIIKTTKLLHYRIPQLGIISWDITINEKNEIVLIEANTVAGSYWLPQMAHGKSLFGDDCDGILQMIKKNKKWF